MISSLRGFLPRSTAGSTLKMTYHKSLLDSNHSGPYGKPIVPAAGGLQSPPGISSPPGSDLEALPQPRESGSLRLLTVKSIGYLVLTDVPVDLT